MSNGTLLALTAAIALAAPSAGAADTAPGSAWSFTVSMWGGASRYDVLGLKHGIGGVGSQDGQDLLDGNFNAMGASAVLRLGWLELGALYEGTLIDGGADSEVFTPVVGFKYGPTDKIRFDVLGELGGHKITNIGEGNDIATETRTVWLPYIGVRPSISFRLPLGPTRLVLSATPFARWDLMKKEVSVQTQTGPDTRTVYEAGGSTFGLVGGIGLEI